jgi:hypothetical protein
MNAEFRTPRGGGPNSITSAIDAPVRNPRSSKSVSARSPRTSTGDTRVHSKSVISARGAPFAYTTKYLYLSREPSMSKPVHQRGALDFRCTTHKSSFFRFMSRPERHLSAVQVRI